MPRDPILRTMFPDPDAEYFEELERNWDEWHQEVLEQIDELMEDYDDQLRDSGDL